MSLESARVSRVARSLWADWGKSMSSPPRYRREMRCTGSWKATTSVGSRGDAYDSALAETINGLYKTEVIRKRGPWRTLQDVEFATLEWVDWFNNRRLLEYTGNIPPAEFEERYYLQQSLVEDEGLKQLSLR